jgi:hypothetical protein
MCTIQLESVRNIIIYGYAGPVLAVISRMSVLVFRREENKKISANICSCNVYYVPLNDKGHATSTMLNVWDFSADWISFLTGTYYGRSLETVLRCDHEGYGTIDSAHRFKDYYFREI